MERIELERKAAFFPAALANTSQTFMVFTPTNDMRALRPAEIDISGIALNGNSGRQY